MGYRVCQQILGTPRCAKKNTLNEIFMFQKSLRLFLLTLNFVVPMQTTKIAGGHSINNLIA